MVQNFIEIIEYILSNKILSVIALPLFLCLTVMLLNAKHREFSRLAILNISATIVIYAFNIIALILLIPNLKESGQQIYTQLALPTLRPDFWDSYPYWVGVLVAIIVIDFADYWNHRLMHTKWFWPTHAAHHSDTHVNAFTTFRIHILEHYLMASSYIILLTWLQLPELIPVVIIISRVHNMYVHMDLPYSHGPLKLLIASPVFHRWHHADTPIVYGKNLANIIPLYDYMFGTYYENGPCNVAMGAKASNIEDVNPVLIYIYPFQTWGKLIKQEWNRISSK